VAINWTQIGKSKCLEEMPGDEERLRRILEGMPQALHPGNTREAALKLLAHPAELRIEPNSLEQVRQRTDVFTDAHAVVV
jgi:hypothetical protein